MADYYTNETKWQLSDGYAESAVNLLSDQSFNCPIHFYSSFAALTANSVSSYHITQKATKHLKSILKRYDLNDYYWLGFVHLLTSFDHFLINSSFYIGHAMQMSCFICLVIL